MVFTVTTVRPTTRAEPRIGHGSTVQTRLVIVVAVCIAVVAEAQLAAASAGPVVYFRNPLTDSLAKSVGRVSTDIATGGNDHPFVSLALDANEQQMFYTNGQAISRALLDGSNATTVVPKVAMYVIGGVNFGTEPSDLVAVELGGVACTSIHYWSSTKIGCVTSNPRHNDGALTVFDVAVVSTHGGRSGPATTDPAYAVRRVAEGYSTPMVSSISKVARSENPRAVAYDPSTRTLLWSDTGSGTIHRSDPDGEFIQLVATGLFEVYGMAVVSDTLFYTDHNDGRVVRVNLTAADDMYDDPVLAGAAGVTRVTEVSTGGLITDVATSDRHAASKVLLRGFSGLRGIAVDAVSGYMYLTEATGNIYRARVDGRNMQRNPRKRKVFAKAIVRRPSTARLDGIAVTQGMDGVNPRRVFWAEANTNAVFSATTYGADVTQLAGQAADMVWPRAVALLPEKGSAYVDHHLFWTQYIGRIHRASTAGANRVVVVDEVDAASGFATVESEVKAAQVAGTPTLFNVE